MGGRGATLGGGISKSPYAWQKQSKITFTRDMGFLQRKKIVGSGYRAKLENGGYASIVKSNDRFFVKVGKYDIYNSESAIKDSHSSMKAALRDLDRFMRRHYRLKIQTK